MSRRPSWDKYCKGCGKQKRTTKTTSPYYCDDCIKRTIKVINKLPSPRRCKCKLCTLLDTPANIFEKLTGKFLRFLWK